MGDGISWILWIVSGLVWCVPRLFFLRDNKELTAEELTVINPSCAWIRKGYPFLMVGMFLVAALIYATVNIWFKDRGIWIYRLGVTLITYLLVVDALIALRSGVYPMPSKGKYRYVYEDGMRLRRIGLYQLVFAIAITAVAIISAFL